MTPNQKIQLTVFVVMVAVFAVAISSVTTVFAQETGDGDGLQSHSDDKTYEGKSGKSCPGKNKEGMSA